LALAWLHHLRSISYFPQRNKDEQHPSTLYDTLAASDQLWTWVIGFDDDKVVTIIRVRVMMPTYLTQLPGIPLSSSD
jgi:hypothetical protein